MRYFEFVDAKSSKFWEVDQVGSDLNIRWGRIGTAGQNQTKNFADAAKAATAMTKLISEKTGKGYVEGAAGSVAATTTAVASVQASTMKQVKAVGTETPAPAIATTDSAQAARAAPATSSAQPSASPSAQAPTVVHARAAPQAPIETLDQQIDRGFEEIRRRIASAELTLSDGTLTAAKIRKLVGVNELASTQIAKQLEATGLVRHWYQTLSDDAQQVAASMKPADNAVPVAALPAANSDLPPWLANGVPLRTASRAELLRGAHPSRRFPAPLPSVDPQRAWLQLRAEIASELEPDLMSTEAALRDDLKAAMASLDDRKMSGSPATDAILMAIATRPTGYHTSDVGARFVHYLAGRAGLPYALDAFLASKQIELKEEYVRNGKNKFYLSWADDSTEDASTMDVLNGGDWALRSLLAVVMQEVYDECLFKVRQALPGLPVSRRPGLGLLFPDAPDLSHDLIRELCALGSGTPGTVHWLQLTATDPEAIVMARKVRHGSYTSMWGRPEMVNTLLLEHGMEAPLWLAPGAAETCAGEALTQIGTPDSLMALARAASTSKDALARMVVAAHRWPAAAVSAMSTLANHNNKDFSLLAPTLLQLLRAHPELPAQLSPWLEPAAREVMEKYAARLSAPQVIATAEQMPAVLAEPPWLKPRKKNAAVMSLAPLSLPPVERWAEGEREEALVVNKWQQDRLERGQKDPDSMCNLLGFDNDTLAPVRKAARDALVRGNVEALVQAWREMIAERRKARYFYYYLDGAAVAWLPHNMGERFWNAVAQEIPCYQVAYVAARFGLAVLPSVTAKIISAPSENFDVALHLGAVDLAPIAARAFAKLKTLRGAGRRWLRNFPEHAACALIAPALGKPSEAQNCAASALRWLDQNGHAALLQQVAARYERPDVVEALNAVLNENPLDRFPAKRSALPEFWQPGGWTRPELHNGSALPDEALNALGTMMGFPTLEETYAGIADVKKACTGSSLANFAWDCFTAWLNSGASSKDGWALTSLGVFGNDDTARKLTPFIRAWPGEAAHARAVTGLDVLAGIGSDVSLMLLNGIAQKSKFKGLQDRAIEKIGSIAEARGLSPEELEDRLAPDLGLDEKGVLVLDFGPRAFRVGFDESLKPFVREWIDGKAGARLSDLPKPKKTDDDAMASAAVERFKLLKKDARTIASQQVLRLEVAMCARRRWEPVVFRQFLAEHPLVRHLVQRLVWAVYAMPLLETDETAGEATSEAPQYASYGGEFRTCFRVAEDGTFTTADDDAFVLPEGAEIRVGLPHAIELPEDQAAAFGQLLADYELLQPFKQLGRETYSLSDEETKLIKLERWKGMKVPTGKVLGLVNIGWRRGMAQDGGCIWYFTKPLGSGQEIELQLDPGIIVGMVDEYPEQTLGEITFGTASAWGGQDKPEAMSELDPIAASELIRDLERLRSDS